MTAMACTGSLQEPELLRLTSPPLLKRGQLGCSRGTVCVKAQRREEMEAMALTGSLQEPDRSWSIGFRA